MYQMTVRTLTGETPFVLTYSSEAIVLAKLGVPTYRVQHFDPNSNDKRLMEQLDILEEKR